MKTLLNILSGLLILAFVAVVAFGFSWLEGDVTVALPDVYGWGQAYDVIVPLRSLAIGLLILLLLVMLITRAVAAMMQMPTLWQRKRHSKAREKGLGALTKGLVAIASGNADEAKRQAKVAAKHLAHDRSGPALALLLQAQSAELSGDTAEAALVYQKLAQDPEAGFLGVRGQLQNILPHALKSGDNSALSLLQAANASAPNSAFVLNARLALAARQQRWQDAREILKQMERAKTLPRPVLRRHETAILLGLSLNDRDRALDYAVKAFQLDPEFTPSSLRAAELAIADDDKKAAARFLEKSWRLHPHPQIIKWWERAAARKNASEKIPPLDLYQWVEKLTRLRPDHSESHLALGIAGLRAGLWGEARQNLIYLHENNQADARAYRALAELELAQYANRAAADEWKEKAHAAKPEPLWVCEECNQTHRNWHPVCPHCGTFDQLEWKTPAQAPVSVFLPVQ